MQFATAPYILRAIYKDEFILDNHITRPLSDLVTAALGAHVTNRYDALLSNLAKGLYVFFSLIPGQTLGEEFCSLLPVTLGATPRLLRLRHKLLLAVLFALEPVALFRFAVRFFPAAAPHDVAAAVRKCVTALFFLFERFATIPHAALRVRLLGLAAPRARAGDEAERGAYALPGLAAAAELAVRLRRALAARRAQREERKERGERGEREGKGKGKGKGAAADEDSDEEDGPRAAGGRCMLCLGNRKQPTATLCGHIFCWRCLSEWINSNAQGAICPFCRRQITLQSLVPLFFYVANPPPTVGGGNGSPALQTS